VADLSPAAQSVLDAADSAFEQAGTTRQGIAAALRAAATQIEPTMEERKTNPNRRGSDFFNGISCGAAQLLSLANELKGQ
jgi:hypothetical protein